MCASASLSHSLGMTCHLPDCIRPACQTAQESGAGRRKRAPLGPPVPACAGVKFSRRPPARYIIAHDLHAIDATFCSMAWRCGHLAARLGQHGRVCAAAPAAPPRADSAECEELLDAPDSPVDLRSGPEAGVSGPPRLRRRGGAQEEVDALAALLLEKL